MTLPAAVVVPGGGCARAVTEELLARSQLLTDALGAHPDADADADARVQLPLGCTAEAFEAWAGFEASKPQSVLQLARALEVAVLLKDAACVSLASSILARQLTRCLPGRSEYETSLRIQRAEFLPSRPGDLDALLSALEDASFPVWSEIVSHLPPCLLLHLPSPARSRALHCLVHRNALTLYGPIVTLAHVPALKSFFQSNSGLTRLCLSYTAVPASSLVALSGLSALKELFLNSIPIPRAAATALAHALPCMPALRTLCIERSMDDDDSREPPLPCMSYHQRRSKYLPCALSRIARAFHACLKLCAITVSGVPVSCPATAATLSQAPALRSLRILHCPDLTTRAAAATLASIAAATGLTELHMAPDPTTTSTRKCTPEGCACIASALAQLTGLRSLSLTKVGLSSSMSNDLGFLLQAALLNHIGPLFQRTPHPLPDLPHLTSLTLSSYRKSADTWAAVLSGCTACTALAALDLSGSTVQCWSAPGAMPRARLADTLAALTTLTELQLPNFPRDESAQFDWPADSLLRLPGKLPLLRKLVISEVDLHTAGAHQLALGIAPLTALQHLALDNCCLTHGGVAHLCRGLQDQTALTELCLNGFCLPFDDTGPKMPGLSGLRALTLSGFPVAVGHARAMFGAFRSLTGLTRLELDSMDVGDDVEVLAPVLVAAQACLRRLTLEFCNLSDGALSALAAVIPKLVALEALDLSGNYTQAMSTWVITLSPDLSMQICPTGWASLMEALVSLPALKELTADDCFFECGVDDGSFRKLLIAKPDLCMIRNVE